MTYKKFYKGAICYPLLIISVITVAWCWAYNIKSPSDLQSPNAYSWDGVAVYALTKAFASGEIYPGLFKFVGTLNAPFSANWNDYPFEDAVFFPAAVMANIFGLSAGLWLYLLGSQLLAGLSFYLATRLLDLQRDISGACAILFALSGFSFLRGVMHLTVTLYWHLPLLLVTLLWCIEPTKLKLSARHGTWLGIASGLLAGVYNPYYWFIFLFLLILILAGTTCRKDYPHALRVAAITAATIIGFLALNADTILFALFFGKGHAVNRNLWELVMHGLRLPDLASPSPGNRLHAILGPIFNQYRKMYPDPLKGEAQWAYVGIIALSGLIVLVLSNTVRLAGRSFDRVNNLYWIALGVFSFAVVGGINYLLGAFGFVILRSTNRYSILFMAIGLLYLTQLVSSLRNQKTIACFAAVVLTLGLYDQLPASVSPAAQNKDRLEMMEDQELANIIESNLKPNAMVFQLPVKPFPETGMIHEMREYDHFRPWLWTKTIRFSYGTMKGRGDADWQSVVGSKPIDSLLDDLSQLGFSALLINRDAYKDGADELKAKVISLGYDLFIEKDHYYGFKLKPTPEQKLTYINRYVLSYDQGFYSPEMEGATPIHWANGDATMTIKKPFLPPNSPSDKHVENIELSFAVQAGGERSVWLEVGSKKELVCQAGKELGTVRLNLEVSSLPVSIHLFSDKPPSGGSSGGDSRKSAFNVQDLHIIPIRN